MTWGRAAIVSALFSAASYFALVAHGHFICADELTVLLMLSFALFAAVTVIYLAIAGVRAIRATLASKRLG
jgi:hypothetical protein